MKNFLLITSTWLFIGSSESQQVDLSLNLKKGQSYTQLLVSTGTVTQSVNGQQQNLVIGITGNISYLVQDLSDSIYEMEVQYKSLSMEVVLPQGTKQFSSEKNDKEDIFSTLLSGMKNQPFHVKMTKRGDILEVKGIEALVSGLFLNFPQLSEEQKLEIKNQFIKAYGEKAFISNVKMVTAIFPPGPVSSGEKWTTSTQVALEMDAVIHTTYEYQGESNSNYLIHGDSRIEAADKDTYSEINGLQLKYNLTGTINSDIKINKETGWIFQAQIIQEMSGDIQIKDNPKVPGGMIIPMAMKNKTQISDR